MISADIDAIITPEMRLENKNKRNVRNSKGKLLLPLI